MDAPPSAPGLARICLDHLALEEAGLRALRDSLSELHRALVAGDMPAVAAFTTQENELADHRRRLDAARESLRRKVTALGLPLQQISITAIADPLPAPWREQADAPRHRTLPLAADVKAIPQRPAAILACCRSFPRHVLAGVCGGEGATE